MDDRRTLQKAADAEFADLLFHHLQPVAVDHVDLGQDHQSLFDPEQSADLEMLPGLGHDPLVGGNDEGQEIHTGNSGHHILDEFLMAGNIDDTKPVTAGKIKKGEPEFNGYPPFLFFLQPVGFDTRQGPDQARFTMVDMTCSTKNNFAHRTLLASRSTDIRIFPLFLADGGAAAAIAMSGPDDGLFRQDHQSADDGIDQLLMRAAGEIGPAETTDKQGVPGDQIGRIVETDTSRCMTRGMDHLQFFLADGNDIGIFYGNIHRWRRLHAKHCKVVLDLLLEKEGRHLLHA